MPKQRTVVITIEVQTTMSLKDLQWHVREALVDYFSEEGEFELRQMRAQVTQAPKPVKSGKTRRPTEVELT